MMTEQERQAYYREKGRLDAREGKGYNLPHDQGPPIIKEVVEMVLGNTDRELSDRKAYKEGYGIGKAERKAHDER